MTIKGRFAREKYVVLHGQSTRFRVVKYSVLLLVLGSLAAWQGAAVMAWVLVVLAIASLAIHFLFRWKTKAWSRPWGPYKPLPALRDDASLEGKH